MMWKARGILIGVASCLINVLKNLICSTRNTLYTYHVYKFPFVIRMDIFTAGVFQRIVKAVRFGLA